MAMSERVAGSGEVMLLKVRAAGFAAELAEAVARVTGDARMTGAVLLLSTIDDDLAETPATAELIASLFRRIETCGKTFAAAIEGSAIGLGLELALACHYRVVVDAPEIELALPAVTMGCVPAAGGTQRLPRLIGIEAALPLLLEGRRVGAQEAREIGLVDALVSAAELVEAARAWVADHAGVQQPWDRKGFRVPGGAGPLAPHAGRSFAAGTAKLKRATSGNDPAPLAILSSVYEGTLAPIDIGLRIEAKYAKKVLAGPVPGNRLRTKRAKQRADALDARPDAPRLQVRRLGVLGAGMMGAGIAHMAAARGIDVVVLDRSSELAAGARLHVERMQAREVERGLVSKAVAETVLGRIKVASGPEDLAGCDLVIEAVFEDRAVKRAVTETAAAVVTPGTLIASNTSTLSISRLAEAVPSPERFIGVHFFSPVERMPLVEIILGRQTAPETLAHALDFVGQLGKTPIVVHDSPGFFTSRIFCSYIDEAMAMLAEGVAPALIEHAAGMAGMAAPPLAVTDEVSLDLQLHVVRQAEDEGLPAKFQRLHAQRVIRALNELGRLGRKSGGGFYDYWPGEKKRLWPGLGRLFPGRPDQPDVESVKRRLLYIQTLESLRCLEEGVLLRAEDGDLGSILGLGFPAWTGGVLSLIPTVGTAAFLEGCRALTAQHGERFQSPPSLLERARAAA